MTMPISERFVICRLGLAMLSPRIKTEASTITCNTEIKGNAKCKHSCFEPHFGYWVTHRIQLRLNGKRIVDCPLGIIELLLSALTAPALLSKI